MNVVIRQHLIRDAKERYELGLRISGVLNCGPSAPLLGGIARRFSRITDHGLLTCSTMEYVKEDNTANTIPPREPHVSSCW